MNTDDAKIKYADIFDLPHHQSANRKHMSLYDRAAQFAPFAALSGYEEMVTEEARTTESEIELSENEIALIDSTLGEIRSMVDNGAHPTVSVTYFIPDRYKRGGSYRTLTAVVKKLDPIGKKLIFYGSEDTEDKRIPTVDVPAEKIISVILQSPSV